MYLYKAFLMISLLCSALSVSASALMVDPLFVTFQSASDTPSIQLTHEGRVLPKAAVRDVKLLVDGHNYIRMLRVEILDGKLVLHATEHLEVGSYDLVIDSDAGTSTVKVYTPLSGHQDVVQQQSQLLNMPEEDVKKLIGLTTELPAQLEGIELLPVYYEGTILKVDLPSMPDRHYRWRINGKVIHEGMGASSLTYVFPEPGDYLLGLDETIGEKTTALVSAPTTVVSKPPVVFTYDAGTQINMQAPEGYQRYAWNRGSELVGSERKYSHTFTHPGEYEVVCTASGPIGGPEEAFVKVTYRFTITDAPAKAHRPWLRPLQPEP